MHLQRATKRIYEHFLFQISDKYSIQNFYDERKM